MSCLPPVFYWIRGANTRKPETAFSAQRGEKGVTAFVPKDDLFQHRGANRVQLHLESQSVTYMMRKLRNTIEPAKVRRVLGASSLKTMQTVDTVIYAPWIIPVQPEGDVYEDCALAVANGRIVAIVPQAEAKQDFHGTEVVTFPSHAIMPGFVNCHTHGAMNLFKGLADDIALMPWLENHIWPAESKWVSERFVRDGTRLAIAEMLRAGTTCFNDMYFYPGECARTATELGMRAVVGLIVLDFPTVWASDANEYITKGIAIHDAFKNEPLIRTAFAPHAPYTVSDPPLERIRVLSDELDIPVHMHVHETAHEVESAAASSGERPLARLTRLGLVNHRLLAVHATQLAPDEIELLAEQGTHVVHCPESNLKLSSGICPVKELVDAGVNVALGTDGAASNNDLSLLAEMRTAALLAKGVSQDPQVIPAAKALSMSTIHGARALGMDDVIGSLEVGKAADLIAIDLGSPETQPVYHPISQIVYAAGAQHVTDVWVAGRRVLRDRDLVQVDLKELLGLATQWGNRINETSAE